MRTQAVYRQSMVYQLPWNPEAMSLERCWNVSISFSSFLFLLKDSDYRIDSMTENIDWMRSVGTVVTPQQREGVLRNGNLHLPFPQIRKNSTETSISTLYTGHFRNSNICRWRNAQIRRVLLTLNFQVWSDAGVTLNYLSSSIKWSRELAARIGSVGSANKVFWSFKGW